jgi:transposase
MSTAPTFFASAAVDEAVSSADERAVLRAENAQLKELVPSLVARIAELERRLGLDSSNSGKPPSSDGLKKSNRSHSPFSRCSAG